VRAATGFTIVELMVAFSILTIGVLGLISVAARVFGLVEEGRYYGRIVSLASGQLEQQLALGCDTTLGGELDTRDALIRWSTATDASGARWMTVAVAGRTRLGTHVDTLAMVSGCSMR
jgi:hypothetical protein